MAFNPGYVLATPLKRDYEGRMACRYLAQQLPILWAHTSHTAKYQYHTAQMILIMILVTIQAYLLCLKTRMNGVPFLGGTHIRVPNCRGRGLSGFLEPGFSPFLELRQLT